MRLSSVIPAERRGAFPAGRAPALPVRRAAAVCAACALAALGGAELFWRSRGWPPNVTDSPALRAVELEKARAAGPGGVVLLGGSRMQLGFDHESFRARFPGRTLSNLSLDGTPEASFVVRLAREGYAGAVLVSLRSDYLRSSHWEASEAAWLGTADVSGIDRVVAAGRAWLTDRVVVSQASLGWRPVLIQTAFHKRLPSPPFFVTRPDRRRTADYRVMAERGELAGHRRGRVARVREGGVRPEAPPEWESNARSLGEAVRMIHSRGGRVVLIRFPTTDEHWDADETRFPKALFWDRLAGLTGAETVHFRDVPALAGFDCPDTSHLDRRDAPAFTAALLDELERRGVL